MLWPFILVFSLILMLYNLLAPFFFIKLWLFCLFFEKINFGLIIIRYSLFSFSFSFYLILSPFLFIFIIVLISFFPLSNCLLMAISSYSLVYSLLSSILSFFIISFPSFINVICFFSYFILCYWTFFLFLSFNSSIFLPFVTGWSHKCYFSLLHFHIITFFLSSLLYQLYYRLFSLVPSLLCIFHYHVVFFLMLICFNLIFYVLSPLFYHNFPSSFLY